MGTPTRHSLLNSQTQGGASELATTSHTHSPSRPSPSRQSSASPSSSRQTPASSSQLASASQLASPARIQPTSGYRLHSPARTSTQSTGANTQGGAEGGGGGEGSRAALVDGNGEDGSRAVRDECSARESSARGYERQFLGDHLASLREFNDVPRPSTSTAPSSSTHFEGGREGGGVVRVGGRSLDSGAVEVDVDRWGAGLDVDVPESTGRSGPVRGSFVTVSSESCITGESTPRLPCGGRGERNGVDESVREVGSQRGGHVMRSGGLAAAGDDAGKMRVGDVPPGNGEGSEGAADRVLHVARGHPVSRSLEGIELGRGGTGPVFARLEGGRCESYRSVDGLPVLEGGRLTAVGGGLRAGYGSAEQASGSTAARVETSGEGLWQVQVAEEVMFAGGVGHASDGAAGVGGYEEETMEKEDVEAWGGYDGDDDLARTGGEGELSMSGTWGFGTDLHGGASEHGFGAGRSLGVKTEEEAGRVNGGNARHGVGSGQMEEGRVVQQDRVGEDASEGMQEFAGATVQSDSGQDERGGHLAMLDENSEERGEEEEEAEEGLSTTAGSSVLGDTLLRDQVFAQAHKAPSVHAKPEDEGGDREMADGQLGDAEEAGCRVDQSREHVQGQSGGGTAPIFSGRCVGSTAEVSIRAKTTAGGGRGNETNGAAGAGPGGGAVARGHDAVFTAGDGGRYGRVERVRVAEAHDTSLRPVTAPAQAVRGHSSGAWSGTGRGGEEGQRAEGGNISAEQVLIESI